MSSHPCQIAGTGGFHSLRPQFMHKPPSLLKILVTGAVLALVLIAWVNFGPRQLGGSVSYVMTHGISMQPRIEEGDLVIVREAATYRRGDVIAYRSEALAQPVLHRIVNQNQQGYVTKGDNNDWLDIDHPQRADVIGKEWIHIPKAGTVLAWFAVPRNAAVLAGAAGLFLFGGSKKRRAASRRRERPAMQTIDITNFMRLDRSQQSAFALVAVVAVASLLIGLLGFTKDAVTAVSQESAYKHQGRFTYEADAPKSAVYPNGQANTGGPLFLKLIDDIRFTFSYSLASDAERELAGTAGLRARISDDHGWQKTLELQTPTRFRGSEVKIGGDLDPQHIQDLTSKVQALTGVAGSYTVAIVPDVQVKGTVGGEPIAETFSPSLTFGLDGLQMKAASADPTAGETDPFKPSQPGAIKVSDISENKVFIGPLDLTVTTARRSSIVGLGLALLASFLLWTYFWRELEDDEAAAIEARYRSWLVPVTKIGVAGKKRVHVADIDSLAKLADRYDRMILHVTNRSGHSYIVQENGIDYVFELNDAPDTTDAVPQAGTTRQARARQEQSKAERDELAADLKEQLRELEAEINSKGTKGPEAG